MHKNYVIGDIHGQCDAMLEVFKMCNFDYKNDTLIILGDIVDGGRQTKQAVDELLKINQKNVIFVRGNHDRWFLEFINCRKREDIWYKQGGKNTLNSYRVKGKITIPSEHIDFFRNSCMYYIDNKRLFVHGGFDIKKGLSHTKTTDILWDRELIEYARKNIIKGYDRVFVGHTTTQTYGSLSEIEDCLRPIFFNNLVMMDCGAGYNGRLSIMNIDTLEHFESSIQKPNK